MPAQTPIWNGSSEIKECPNSPVLGRDNTRFSVERYYEGPYDQCSGNKPVQGQAFADLPAACLVTFARVLKLPGNKGRIEVKAETSGPSDTTPYAPTFEIEWRPVEKKIETHSRYADGTDGTVEGPKSLTLADRAALQLWEAEDDFILRAQFFFKRPADDQSITLAGYSPTTIPAAVVSPITINGVSYKVYALSTNAIDLAKKKLKGVDSYRVFYPVARATKESITVPSTNPCNIIGAPSITGIPDGYVWISSAWRGTKTGRYGKWEQQLEYEGNTAIDTDLYPQEPSLVGGIAWP